VTPGWLFSNNFGASIHPRYGIIGQLNLTNVPSGFEKLLDQELQLLLYP
jgi:hypothetical protein